MESRRAFLGLATGASLLAVFRNDGLDRVLAAGRGEVRAPDVVASDEDFWYEVDRFSEAMEAVIAKGLPA